MIIVRQIEIVSVQWYLYDWISSRANNTSYPWIAQQCACAGALDYKVYLCQPTAASCCSEMDQKVGLSNVFSLRGSWGRQNLTPPLTGQLYRKSGNKLIEISEIDVIHGDFFICMRAHSVLSDRLECWPDYVRMMIVHWITRVSVSAQPINVDSGEIGSHPFIRILFATFDIRSEFKQRSSYLKEYKVDVVYAGKISEIKINLSTCC